MHSIGTRHKHGGSINQAQRHGGSDITHDEMCPQERAGIIISRAEHDEAYEAVVGEIVTVALAQISIKRTLSICISINTK